MGDAPSSTPYLAIDRVTRRFGGLAAVDDLSLDIHRGELFCLLGASGCGKTTLLRMLGGFEVPSAGRIVLDGEDLTAVPPYRRPVNMMFQSYALFPHMTVEGNVAFGLRQEGLARAGIRTRVAEILDLVEMGAYARRRPHQLSGGQMQRVALARALVKRPKLLLLDEPMGALDRKLRERTQLELARLQQRLGVTFVVVTHDQEEAMTLATRIGVMHEGRLAQVGTPGEIYDSPSCRYVADFIGSVNLLEGRVAASTGEGSLIECEAAGCRVVSASPLAAPRGSTCWVAIRPEQIQVDPPGDAAAADAPNRITARVREVVYLGSLSHLLLALPGGGELRITIPNRGRGPDGRLAPGDPVQASWDPSSVVVLTR
jgi:putrescine transport system ATP-binding protein